MQGCSDGLFYILDFFSFICRRLMTLVMFTDVNAISIKLQNIISSHSAIVCILNDNING